MSIPKLFAPVHPGYTSRRAFLRRAGHGFGLLALAGLLDQQGLLPSAEAAVDPRNPLAPRQGHFPGKARSIIWLFMNGGPSHVDTWDYKPALAQRDGQELKGFDKNTGFFTEQVGPIMKSPFKFAQHGQCGAWASELFPNLSKHVDRMAFLYSCWTDSNNHSPALLKINSGMARIESFELAYRMQMAAPEALDLTKETQTIHKLYGVDNPKCTHFAKQCLIARRLVERGVRFVQIYSGGEENEKSWDGHQNIVKNHTGFAGETDIPIAGLLTDLASRGLLDSTLVVWGGEFGRLPIVQKGGTGRDHNPHAFTYWLAGAGVKGGTLYGKTDEIGFKSEVDRVSVHDLHATVLHLAGIDHKRLTYRYNGRDFRLTDVSGNVVKEILL